MAGISAHQLRREDMNDLAGISAHQLRRDDMDDLAGVSAHQLRRDGMDDRAGVTAHQLRRDDMEYHQRSNIESTFSMVKAKFRDHVRSKTDMAMKNEVLTKFLCHNIVVVHQSQIELGIEAEFWKDEKEEGHDVLPMVPA